MSFAQKYGPWAVITGASEGTGREFARQVAAEGVNLILVARREGPLEELADAIRKEAGIECITASVDLTEDDAAARIAAAAAGREVGLYISNAGSDTNGAMFLDKDIDTWFDLVALNALTPLRNCHHFGKGMRERGRGGILLVGSGACHGSGPYMATYSAAKAFDYLFAQGLWAELQPHGVDVLFYGLNRTDTPALRTLLAEKGMPVPAGLADPAEVARLVLSRLPFGPVGDWGFADDEVGPGGRSGEQVRQRVEMIANASRAIFGSGKS